MTLVLKKGMWVIITNPQSEYYFEEGAYTGEWEYPMWNPVLYKIRLTIDGKHKDVYFPLQDLREVKRKKYGNIDPLFETLHKMNTRNLIDRALDNNDRELFHQVSTELKNRRG